MRSQRMSEPSADGVTVTSLQTMPRLAVAGALPCTGARRGSRSRGFLAAMEDENLFAP
jgi:hypothetical protein